MQSSWKLWLQGRATSTSFPSTAFRQTGQEESGGGGQSAGWRGRARRKALDVGGGGLSANMPAKASWSQFPESTRNLGGFEIPTSVKGLHLIFIWPCFSFHAFHFPRISFTPPVPLF